MPWPEASMPWPQEFLSCLAPLKAGNLSGPLPSNGHGQAKRAVRLIHPDTVKTRLHRARRMMRARLRERLCGNLHDLFPFDGPRCDRITEAVMRRPEIEGVLARDPYCHRDGGTGAVGRPWWDGDARRRAVSTNEIPEATQPDAKRALARGVASVKGRSGFAVHSGRLEPRRLPRKPPQCPWPAAQAKPKERWTVRPPSWLSRL